MSHVPMSTPWMPRRRRSFHLRLILVVTSLSRSSWAFLARSTIPATFYGPLHTNPTNYQRIISSNATPDDSASTPQHLIDLQTFLKLTDLVTTGGEAKRKIQEGGCKVNGLQEERRSKKLFPGDVVELNGVVLDVQKEVARRGYIIKVKLPKEQRPGYTAPTKAKEYSGEFRTEEWRTERKEKKYARKKEKQNRGEGVDE